MITAEFSKYEFRLLLELVDGMDWVLHCHKVKEDPRTSAYRKVMTKLYARAAEVGMKDIVHFDKATNSYHLADEFSETNPLMDFIEEFNEDEFWGEIPFRLGERDFVQAEGIEKIKKMSDDERFTVKFQYIDRYEDEMASRGINRLVVQGVTPPEVIEAVKDFPPYTG